MKEVIGMDEFSALITSFGTQMVAHIGQDNLEALLVRPYQGSDTADVLIRLSENTWDNQLVAMEKIDSVRLMFLGEISFEYRFLAEGDVEPESRALESGQRHIQFA